MFSFLTPWKPCTNIWLLSIVCKLNDFRIENCWSSPDVGSDHLKPRKLRVLSDLTGFMPDQTLRLTGLLRTEDNYSESRFRPKSTALRRNQKKAA
jgi:hypothetical protein